MNFIKKTKHNISAAGTLLASTLLIPVISIAATTPTDFKGVVKLVLDVINGLVQLVLVLALLFFVYNIFKLVFAGGDEKSRTEAKTFMFYGIIALFVMVSVWGLVNILTSTFFGSSFIVPQLK
ncbi:MAG: hypothetical protein V4664_00560 [Patescibacteria group bacterium]